jgi:hypothetical protein
VGLGVGEGPVLVTNRRGEIWHPASTSSTMDTDAIAQARALGWRKKRMDEWMLPVLGLLPPRFALVLCEVGE